MFINDHVIDVSEHKSDFDTCFKINLRNVKKLNVFKTSSLHWQINTYLCISANVWIHLNILCTPEAITSLFASPDVFMQ